MKTWKLMLLSLFTCMFAASIAFAGPPREGDAVYRDLDLGDMSWSLPTPLRSLGARAEHTGILDQHTGTDIVYEMGKGGVRTNSFRSFTRQTPYRGATHKGQSRVQGQMIALLARQQKAQRVSYNFTFGWKRPGRSFRCDGLVEYCYETVGFDIVRRDYPLPTVSVPGAMLSGPVAVAILLQDPFLLYPARQRRLMRAR